MFRNCPICNAKIKVVESSPPDPLERPAAWFARHKDWRTGKQCGGSGVGAVDGEPQPTLSDSQAPVA